MKTINFQRYAGITALFFLLVLLACDNQEALAKSKRGYLGVTVEEMTPSMRAEMKLGKRSGLLVTGVIPGSPADEAGLEEDDVIVKFDGKAVEQVDDFVELVGNTAPKNTVRIDLVRDGSDQSLKAVIGRKRSRSFGYFLGDNAPHVSVWSDRPRLGVQLQELNEDLAAYFPGAEKGGALVLEVVKDSPAEDAGLKAGDVIVQIDDEAVADPEDVIDLLGDYDAGDKVQLAYLRKGSRQSAEVELAEDGGVRWHQFEHPVPRAERFHLKDRHRRESEFPDQFKVIIRDKDGTTI